jgi:hypothetical protein
MVAWLDAELVMSTAASVTTTVVTIHHSLLRQAKTLPP